jgi:branched-chain amino acid transport system substrate-binding protein
VRRDRFVFQAGSLLALVALVAACSGGATPAASSAAASGTYLVGVPMPMTGAEAQSGTEIFNAEKLAADQINAAGGVLGHKIVLNEQDDACDPQTSVNAANKLVSLGVQAVVGSYCSSATLPAEPIYARANIPNLQPSANAATLTQHGYTNVFLLDPSGGFQAQTAAAFFTNILHAKTVFIADDQSAYSVDIADLTQQALTKAGVTVLPIQAVPATTQDFSPVITTIRSSNPDAIYWTGYYAQAALFVRQLRGAGITTPYAVADGSVDPAYIKDAGAANADGSYATIATTTQFLTGSAAQKFTQDYKAAYGTDPGPYSAYGYDAMDALVKAAQAAGSLEPAKVIAALRTLKFDGLTGSVSFAPDGARQGAKFVVLVVQNGQYALNPTQP